MPAPLTLWLVVLAAAFVVQVLGWAWVAAGLRRVRADAALASDALAETAGEDDVVGGLPISVVVAAHDEAERLPALLRSLAAQTHRPFEVVVVDDRSTDATADTVGQWARRFPVPLRVVSVTEGEPRAAGLPPKKHALERGAAAAAHTRLAFTDADGCPGPDWLATLARWSALGPLAEDSVDAPDVSSAASTIGDAGAVMVGFGPYQHAPGWLNRFVRYETVQTAALAAAAIGWGRPWHAVGRNLSYPAALLERLGGFGHSAGSLSGDDDLLVQEVARRGAAPVIYVWDAAAAVPPPPRRMPARSGVRSGVMRVPARTIQPGCWSRSACSTRPIWRCGSAPRWRTWPATPSGGGCSRPSCSSSEPCS